MSYPDSAICSPLFSLVWGISLVGAAREEGLSYPLDGAWLRFIGRHLSALERVRDHLISDASFPHDVADMLLDDWRQRGDNDTIISPHHLSMRIAALLGNRKWLADEVNQQYLDDSARHLMVLLAESLWLAEYAAMLNEQPFSRMLVSNLLWEVHRLSGLPSPFDAAQPEVLVANITSHWKREREATVAETLPAFIEWLRTHTDGA
jgi:hypothetical protein